MPPLAFAAPFALHPLAPSAGSRLALLARRPLAPPLAAKPRKLSATPPTPTWRASLSPDPNNPAPADDDDALQEDLSAKVQELFGGRQNVTIDVEPDSNVRFIVRDNARPAQQRRRQRQQPQQQQQQQDGQSAVVQRLRSPWYIVSSIAVVSLVTGAVFTALYYSGAVHGYDGSDPGHYEMPTYGKSSYIDPYELLEQEAAQLQSQGEQSP